MIDSLGVEHKTYEDYLEQARGQSREVDVYLRGKWFSRWDGLGEWRNNKKEEDN